MKKEGRRVGKEKIGDKRGSHLKLESYLLAWRPRQREWWPYMQLPRISCISWAARILACWIDQEIWGACCRSQHHSAPGIQWKRWNSQYSYQSFGMSMRICIRMHLWHIFIANAHTSRACSARSLSTVKFSVIYLLWWWPPRLSTSSHYNCNQERSISRRSGPLAFMSLAMARPWFEIHDKPLSRHNNLSDNDINDNNSNNDIIIMIIIIMIRIKMIVMVKKTYHQLIRLKLRTVMTLTLPGLPWPNVLGTMSHTLSDAISWWNISWLVYILRLPCEILTSIALRCVDKFDHKFQSIADNAKVMTYRTIQTS